MSVNQLKTAGSTSRDAMTKLSRFVSVYEPAGSRDQDAASPRLIVVASWMDARDAHIAKYIDQYQALYPESKILLIKNTFSHILWESTAATEGQPAVSYVRSLMDSGYLSPSPSRPEILVHVLSNGGVASTKTLFNSYRQQTGRTFPSHTTIYDSCPGWYAYSNTQKVLMASVPKGVLSWIIAPFVHLLNMYFWIVISLGWPYGLVTNAAFHNNPKENQETNRTYIYSPSDEMVDWRHIEEHTRQAEVKGFTVKREVFPDSPHVAHVRADGRRYWKIVRETWDKGRMGV